VNIVPTLDPMRLLQPDPAPYRILFPLGAILGALGVGHWLLYTRGLSDTYSGQGHALVQMQAFLLAFACGFLMTMLPRRTQTSGPARMEVLGLALALIGVGAPHLTDRFALGQIGYLIALALLIRFAASRVRQSAPERRPPRAFVLVPCGLVAAVGGGLLLWLAAADRIGPWGVAVGRGLVQEATFLGLVLGVGHLLHPALMGPPADPRPAPLARVPGVYPALGLLLLATYPAARWLENTRDLEFAVRSMYLLRAGLVTAILGLGMRAYRTPRAPGLNRWFVWIAFWMIPLGLWFAGFFPPLRVAYLHVTFVGGFSLLTFAISGHVVAVHGGRPELALRRPWQVGVFGGLFLFAMVTRVSADSLITYSIHIEGAALAWMLALVFWAVFAGPGLRNPGDAPHPGEVSRVRS